MRGDVNYAWPTAEIAVMGAEGRGGDHLPQRHRRSAEDRRSAPKNTAQKFANPFVAGARGFIDDVIMPHSTRKRICRAPGHAARQSKSRTRRRNTTTFRCRADSCSRKSSSPIAARSPAGSSGPAAPWASRPWPSIPTPTPMRCMCAMADEAVHIGAPPAAQSYLLIDSIVEACQQDRRRGRASRLRLPLGERRSSPHALKKAGIVFIGPPAKAIAAMGDKIESKKLAKKARVNTVPGYLGVIKDDEEAVKIAHEIGYPVMIKASAGGGGKGMRIARSDQEVREGFRAAKQRGQVQLRRRPGLHREIHRGSAPHRNPDPRPTATAIRSIWANANAPSSAATRR